MTEESLSLASCGSTIFLAKVKSSRLKPRPPRGKSSRRSIRLPDIAALTATLRLEPWGRGGARVTGAVHGELTQLCIVSVEPFPATVDEDVDVQFAPPKAA